MRLFIAVAVLALTAAPAAATWAPAQPISKPRERARVAVVGPAGHVVYRDGRRVVRVSPAGRRRVLGRTRRPYERAAVDRRGNVVVLYRLRLRSAQLVRRPLEMQTISAAGRVSRPRRLARSTFAPELAANDAGDVVAAWVRDLPGDRTAVAVAQGTVRRGLRTVGRVATARASHPAAALSPRGLALVSFVHNGRLTIVGRPPGGRFGGPRDIGPAASPDIALSVNRLGDAVIAWSDAGAVRAAVRRLGAWGSAQDLGTGRAPSALMTVAGRALAGWVAGDSPATPRVAEALPGATGFGAPRDLHAPIPLRAILLAEEPAGTVHAAWVRDSGVQVATQPAGGDWSEGVTIHEAPARGVVLRGDVLALVSPGGVQTSRYSP